MSDTSNPPATDVEPADHSHAGVSDEDRAERMDDEGGHPTDDPDVS